MQEKCHPTLVHYTFPGKSYLKRHGTSLAKKWCRGVSCMDNKLHKLEVQPLYHFMHLRHNNAL